MKNKTHGNRVRNVEAKQLVHTLFNTIEGVEDRTLGDTPNKVEEKALVDTPPLTAAAVEPKKHTGR